MKNTVLGIETCRLYARTYMPSIRIVNATYNRKVSLEFSNRSWIATAQYRCCAMNIC